MGYEFLSDAFSTAEAAALLRESRVKLQKWLSSGSPVQIHMERHGEREYRYLRGKDLIYLVLEVDVDPLTAALLDQNQRLDEATWAQVSEQVEPRFTEYPLP